jgi:tetratricopeptide (TPR) repeat protein
MNDELMRLRQFFIKHFNLQELRSLCLDLKIDYDELREGGKSDKVVDLIRIIIKEDKYEQLPKVLPKHKKEQFLQANLAPTPKLLKALGNADKRAVWPLLALLGLIGTVTLGFVIFRGEPSDQPPVSKPISVGIGTLDECVSAWEESVAENAPESEEMQFAILGTLKDREAARAFVGEHNLVIWGKCESESKLLLRLELLRLGPAYVVELDSFDILVDSDQFSRLSRAMINYIHGNFAETAVSLATLRAEASFSKEEEAQLTFLQANSLLFAGDYETAVSIYDEILTYAPLTASAYNNRGVAHMSHALQLQETGQPFDNILQTALDDFSQASSQTDMLALASINRAQAKYLIDEAYISALDDCNNAIATTDYESLAYVCRAAAQLTPLLINSECNLPTINNIREDLDTAENRNPDLATIKYWRGHLLLLQAYECDPPDGTDQTQHITEGITIFQAFIEQMNLQTVQLAIEKQMIELATLE